MSVTGNCKVALSPSSLSTAYILVDLSIGSVIVNVSVSPAGIAQGMIHVSIGVDPNISGLPL